MSLFNQYIERYRRVEEECSLEEFLAICKQDRMAYASSAERMLAAIGEAELVDNYLHIGVIVRVLRSR